MNIPLVNQYTRRNGDLWTANPMQGIMPMCLSVAFGWFHTRRQVSTRCSPADEVIDLVDDNSSEGTPVNQVAMKCKEICKRKLVIVIMDDDDDTSLETSQPPVIEIEDSSLGSMSAVSDGSPKGMDDCETLTDTFDSETSSSVTLPCFENGSVIVTAGVGLVWDGGSLSFPYGLKNSEILEMMTYLPFPR